MTEKLTEKDWACLKACLKKYCSRYSDAQWRWCVARFGVSSIKKRIRSEWGGGDSWLSFGGSDGLMHCCGVGEIETRIIRASGENSISEMMLDEFLSCRKHVIATCNSKQKDKCKMLKDWGFRVTRNWAVNPNTGRKIIVLMYTFP